MGCNQGYTVEMKFTQCDDLDFLSFLFIQFAVLLQICPCGVWSVD